MTSSSQASGKIWRKSQRGLNSCGHPAGVAGSLGSAARSHSTCNRFDAIAFGAFPKKLLRHRTPARRKVTVLDNARSLHAFRLAPLLKKYRAVWRLLSLPPYRPQLALIERVYKFTRRVAAHNRIIAALGNVRAAVDMCFVPMARANCVLHPSCGIIQDAIFSKIAYFRWACSTSK